jgi:hypothetical protein
MSSQVQSAGRFTRQLPEPSVSMTIVYRPVGVADLAAWTRSLRGVSVYLPLSSFTV